MASKPRAKLKELEITTPKVVNVLAKFEDNTETVIGEIWMATRSSPAYYNQFPAFKDYHTPEVMQQINDFMAKGTEVKSNG